MCVCVCMCARKDIEAGAEWGFTDGDAEVGHAAGLGDALEDGHGAHAAQGGVQGERPQLQRVTEGLSRAVQAI